MYYNYWLFNLYHMQLRTNELIKSQGKIPGTPLIIIEHTFPMGFTYNYGILK